MSLERSVRRRAALAEVVVVVVARAAGAPVDAAGSDVLDFSGPMGVAPYVIPYLCRIPR